MPAWGPGLLVLNLLTMPFIPQHICFCPWDRTRSASFKHFCEVPPFDETKLYQDMARHVREMEVGPPCPVHL